jgi:hypothetical protein
MMGETCVDGVLAEGKLGHVYSIAGKFLDRQVRIARYGWLLRCFTCGPPPLVWDQSRGILSQCLGSLKHSKPPFAIRVM